MYVSSLNHVYLASQAIKISRSLLSIVRRTYSCLYLLLLHQICPIRAYKFHIRFVFYFPRYITVAYFLNDVDDGGEVVLPLANSKFEVFRLMPLSCLCL